MRLDDWPDETGVETHAYSDGGVQRLLLETQIDLTAPGVATCYRLLQRVLSRQGAEHASHVSVEFDPSHERLEIHRLGVWRAGTVIEHGRPEAVQILRREQRLERLALDGRLTATWLVPDLRVDDRLELIFTRYSLHPVLEGKFFSWLAFNAYAPWLETRFRLSRPVERPFWIKGFNQPPAAFARTDAGVEVLQWTEQRPQRLAAEERQPPWTLDSPCYQISELESWGEVARLFEPHYRDETLPEEILPEEILATLRDLRARYANSADRAVEWLRHVQTELRYFALSLGQGGLVPRPLSTIWSQRFGDCKDASRLYVAGARYLGLAACPALVSSTRGVILDRFLPSAQVFDHVIVRLTLEGVTWWLDPTLPRQGGPIESLTLSCRGWALPLTPESNSLEPLPETEPVELVACDELIELGPRRDSVARVTRRLRFRQSSADHLRNSLAGEGAAKLFERLLGEVRAHWPGATLSAAPSVEDDAAANLLTISSHYEIRDVWRESGAKRLELVHAEHLCGRELFPIHAGGPRRNEIYLGRPRRVMWQTRLHMPCRWHGSGLSEVVDEAGVRYTSELLVQGKSLLMTKTLTVDRWTAGPQAADGYARLVTATQQSVSLLYARTSFGRIRPPPRGWRFYYRLGGLPLRLLVGLAFISILQLGGRVWDYFEGKRSSQPPPVWSPDYAPQRFAPIVHGDLQSELAHAAFPLFSQGNARDAYISEWLDAVQMVSLDSAAAAYPRLSRLIDAPRFVTLTNLEQHAGLVLAAAVAMTQRDDSQAHEYLVRSSGMDRAATVDWSMRAFTAQRLHDWGDAMHSLTMMLQRWPMTASSVKLATVQSLVVPLPQDPQRRQAAHELMVALFNAGWKKESGVEPHEIWALLVQDLVERGDLTRAAAVVTHIHNLRVLLSMRADRRYDALVKLTAASFDLDAAGRAYTDDYLKATFKQPHSLTAVEYLARTYMARGDYASVLSLTGDVIDKVAKAGSAQNLYGETAESLEWIDYLRARALEATGNDPEAERALRRAGARLESGKQNVSNVINLAAFYAERGRGKEALATLEPLVQQPGLMSEFGRMQLEDVKVIAGLSLGDKAGVARSMSYLREHRSAAERTFEQALVRTGAMDEAARVYIHRLRNPDTHVSALLDAQIYTLPPEPPATTEFRRRYAAMLARSDVLAAIDAIGRREHTSIPPGSF